MPPLRINTLGTRWEVDLDGLERDSADGLRRLWRDCGDWTADPSEPPGFPRRLRAAHEPPGDDPLGERHLLLPGEPEAIAYAFSGELTAKAIAAQAGRLTLLHSAALAHPETGATVLLIASSGTGKTTAACRLGRRLSYLSDETAAVRADLSVIAHAKPPSIVQPGGGKAEAAPADLGLLPVRRDAWVALTVLLDREEGRAPQLEPVALVDALVAVIPQSSSLPAQAAPFSALVGVLTAGAGVHVLHYGEIDEAAPLLLEVLGQVARGDSSAPELELVGPDAAYEGQAWVSEPGVTELSITPELVVTRGAWVDAVRVADEVLVLNGPGPMRLMGLGSTLWLAADRPRTVAELAAAVLAAHGPHPEADRIIGESVAALAGQGLLRPHPGG
ncbi:MAG: hypothetical protein V9G19_11675 [Tetrasphaera sp.]